MKHAIDTLRVEMAKIQYRRGAIHRLQLEDFLKQRSRLLQQEEEVREAIRRLSQP